MKNLKKLLCIMLSMALLFSMSSTTFASDSNILAKVKNSSSVRIAETSDSNYTYKAIYDKDCNTIQLIKTNKSTGEVNAGKVTKINEVTQDKTILRASLKENTFTNYEYTITYGKTNKWQLRRPGDNAFNWVYFDTYQTSNNKDYLLAFQDAVDEINIQEGAIVGALGMTGLSYLAAGAAGAGAIFTGGTLTGAAWGAILAAGGFSTAYVASCMAYDQSCKNAYDSYWNTYYNSKIL